MDRNVNVINTSSRCVNTSCKLINGLKEKRETMQRSPNLICEKSSGDNATHDNVSLQRKISKKESRKAESIQEMNVKVNDGNVWCKDTTSSTKDGHYCENTYDVDFPQRDLSSSIAPCSSFSVCDGARQTQPSITQHPSKTRARLDDREVFISRTICTDAERRDHYKNKDRRNVGGDDNELRFADGRICRNKTLQESIMERNNILKRMERKLLQSFERWQREQVAREWSTCSCIVEKDEDYYASIDGVEKELPEDTRNVAECPGKVFARRTCSKTLTEGTEFSEKDFEIIRKNHLKGTNIDETRFKNSAEPSSKATKVCMESVLEEPSKDIAVSKTVLGEPNRLTEEVIVYKTALSDSKDTPKEITRKEIPDSNSVGQSDVNRLSLNDMKNKFAGENVNSSNSNSLEEKAEEMKVKLIDKPDNDTLNFASQQTAAIIDITVPKNRTVPKLLRIIAEKKSHNIPTTVDFKFEEPKVESTPDKIITTIHVDQEKIPEEKAILKEHASVEIVEEIKTNDSIASEMRVNTIETNAEDDSSKEESDKDEVFKDIQDETTEIHVTCPQKEPEEESQKPILYKCGLPSDSNTDACSIAKCAKDCANQGNPEEEPQKSTLCKRDLAFILNNYAYSIVKCTKCDNIIGGCAYKDNRFEWKKMYCVCCLLTTQCTCAPHSKSYLKIDKPKFHDVSPLTIGPHICRSCCKESECRKMKMYAHEECKYRRCAIRGDCSRINEHERESQVSCINCGRPRNQCCCTTFTSVKCYDEGNRGRTMICLYCDNPKDKCTCKVPVGKRSYCGLPLDVCNCRDDEGYARDCKWIVKRPENQTIYVTNWKPNWESKRGFAKNAEDLRSCFTEERQSYEKPKRGHTKELPNQRSNSFSEVMNELQRRISESACCARCWKNPCCCKSPVDQDKRKEERKVENRVKYAEIEELSISKSPNNCRCGRSPKSEHKSTLEKSIRRIGCICQLTLCKCGNSRINYRRPLAKCYYCKSLPCTCITVD